MFYHLAASCGKHSFVAASCTLPSLLLTVPKAFLKSVLLHTVSQNSYSIVTADIQLSEHPFLLELLRRMWRKGLFLPSEGEKNSWSHYVSDTNSITWSVPFSAKHFLNFVTAAGPLPADIHPERCPQEETNLRVSRLLRHSCLLNRGDQGPSREEWGVQARLWGPALFYPSLIPITQSFQWLKKKKKKKSGASGLVSAPTCGERGIFQAHSHSWDSPNLTVFFIWLLVHLYILSCPLE